MSDLVQGTEEWHAARCGRITASRIADVMARTKSGYGAGRKNYMAELVVERMTEAPTEGFVSAEMRWGIEQEPSARFEYAMRCADVETIGFVLHPELDYSGASPDGLVGDDGMVEIKCPNTATHIETIETGTIKRQYLLQMQWQMACTDRQWCDFVSYDPRMRDRRLIFYRQRVERDEKLIAEIRAEVEKFHGELRGKIERLQQWAKEAT